MIVGGHHPGSYKAASKSSKRSNEETSFPDKEVSDDQKKRLLGDITTPYENIITFDKAENFPAKSNE